MFPAGPRYSPCTSFCGFNIQLRVSGREEGRVALPQGRVGAVKEQVRFGQEGRIGLAPSICIRLIWYSAVSTFSLPFFLFKQHFHAVLISKRKPGSVGGWFGGWVSAFPLHRLLQHRHHGQSGPAEPSSQKKHPETPCHGLMRHQKTELDKFMEMLCECVSPGIGDSQCPWLNLQQQVGRVMCSCAL